MGIYDRYSSPEAYSNWLTGQGLQYRPPSGDLDGGFTGGWGKSVPSRGDEPDSWMAYEGESGQPMEKLSHAQNWQRGTTPWIPKVDPASIPDWATYEAQNAGRVDPNTGIMYGSADNTLMDQYYSDYFTVEPRKKSFLSNLASQGPLIASGAFLGGALGGYFDPATAGAGAGAGTAANTAGLTQMGTAAGLTGAELEAFVASGGTLGSMAAGGGGIGLDAAGTVAGTVAGTEGLYSGPEFQGAVPPQSTGPGPTLDAFGRPVGGGGYFPAGSPGAGTVAGSAAAGSALSRIIDGTATTADWVQVLGTAGATGLGIYSANQQSDTLARLAAENRADRAPYLQASQDWLANPSSYVEGPGQAAMKGTLAGLSAKFGNPIGSPTAMAISSEAALRDWRDAVTGFGNMGLSGADTRANLGVAGAAADASRYTTAAGGLSDIINPRRSLSDLLREYRTVFA